MTEERKLPEGRLGRLVKLAGLGARTGASLLLAREAKSAAEQAAEVLGTMRGLAAKIGQMASYVDGVVPEAQRDAWETSLRALRAAAPTSSPAAIRAVVEEDLGAPIDRLFAEWEERPFASASIGQVHRARLLDGAEVAVKVQHPGVARAVDADLENAGMLEVLVGNLGARKLNSRGILEEIRAKFREELDYALEAERQRAFVRLHAGDPTIVVPRVVDDRSGPRVLTSELVRGAALEDVLHEPEPQRRAWCETLWRYVFKGNLIGGMFNADPHPGNYLFQEDGRVAFLDYGCVQPIEGERLTLARDLHWSAVRGDEAAFRTHAAELLWTRGGRYEELAVAYSRRCFEPIFASPYRVERDWSAALVRQMRDIGLEMRKGADEAAYVPLPPGMLFINRLQAGFYSVLARLGAEADYRAVERGFLAPLFA